MPEFGAWPYTESVARGITRNPWDPTRTPGGSSGGTAAAVAVRAWCRSAIGGDGGGSIRIPRRLLRAVRAQAPARPGHHRPAPAPVVGARHRRAADPHRARQRARLRRHPRQRSTADLYRPPANRLVRRGRRAASPGGCGSAGRPSRSRSGCPARPGPRPGRPRTPPGCWPSSGHDVREVDPHYPDPTAAFVPQFFAGIRTEADAVEHYDRLERRTRADLPARLLGDARGSVDWALRPDREGLGEGQPGLRRRRRAAHPRRSPTGRPAPASSTARARSARAAGLACRRSPTPRCGTSPATPPPPCPCGLGRRRPPGRGPAGRPHRRRGDAAQPGRPARARPALAPRWPVVRPVWPHVTRAPRWSTWTMAPRRSGSPSRGSRSPSAEGGSSASSAPTGPARPPPLESSRVCVDRDAGTIACWAGLLAARPGCSADRRPAAGLGVLRTAHRPRAVRRSPPVRRAVRRRTSRWSGRDGGQGRHPRRGPVRRAGPAALDRVRTGARSRGARSWTSRRPALDPQARRTSGPPPASTTRGRDRGADHALHGRGRGTLRPGGHHGRRPDPRVRLAGRAHPQSRCPWRGSRSRPVSSPWTRQRWIEGVTMRGERRRDCAADPATDDGRLAPCDRGQLDGVRVQTGTLEDVFLDLTGREYRA